MFKDIDISYLSHYFPQHKIIMIRHKSYQMLEKLQSILFDENLVRFREILLQ